ncbi:MAG TPA: aspartate aminotransferase family protein [Candidatus Rubrimentiphilum sp.]|nr:aspartate aminotransferase family protein [Candidatus Rubrimentiphilum sp.]
MTPIPGERSFELAHLLRKYESRNVTHLSDESPVFWESSGGSTVTDVDGNEYIDLTAGFGVANAGHSNPNVAAAISQQAARLMHAMGDVHPAEIKVRLLEKLAAITPGNLTKTFLASSGADAVEAAMKTAMLATGKSAFAAFRGSYHGLSIGTLEISGIKKFREPFLAWLPEKTLLLDYPKNARGGEQSLEYARRAFSRRYDLAAVIVEPVQGRGGCIVPPKNYLAGLREICRERGLLMICDEIYTGFGRTGTMFACDYENIVPDILCVGKAMANGFPISAAIATPDVMDAWPPSDGEALHTSTHLGNPMGCAAALASIAEIEERNLPKRTAELGVVLGSRLESLRVSGKAAGIRGRGLMWGIELHDPAHARSAVERALKRGVILLQAGEEGNTLSLTPPLVIPEDELMRAVDVVESCL